MSLSCDAAVLSRCGRRAVTALSVAYRLLPFFSACAGCLLPFSFTVSELITLRCWRWTRCPVTRVAVPLTCRRLVAPRCCCHATRYAAVSPPSAGRSLLAHVVWTLETVAGVDYLCGLRLAGALSLRAMSPRTHARCLTAPPDTSFCYRASASLSVYHIYYLLLLHMVARYMGSISPPSLERVHAFCGTWEEDL